MGGYHNMNFTIEYNKKLFELKNISPELNVIKAAVEQEFSLRQGAYTLSYLDIENDPIAVEDEDDLAVCILEFSEMSKIDDCVNLGQRQEQWYPKEDQHP